MGRLILPLAVPVGVALFAFVVIFSISRVLLNVPKEVAPAVALAIALLILAFSWFLASRPAGNQSS